ncbi:hypothetical protein SY212_03750 [Ligilactobacillus agilis]|uniref:Uncharacterized protein n=1 Tax=Ligilactobacillus agilis TaxID=1601 RepID=A0A6F9XJG8_9LACO|nr:hypothetical protein SY212_03750 [Ligilactobacillus agilis]
MTFHIGINPALKLLKPKLSFLPMTFHIGINPVLSNLPIILDIGFLGNPHTYSVLQIRII